MLRTSTQRMIRNCKENKFKVPVWKQKDNITTSIFPEVSQNRIDKKKFDVVNDVVKKVMLTL